MDGLTNKHAATVGYVARKYARMAKSAPSIDADDLRQEAALRVWLKGRERGDVMPANYVARAARTAAWNAIRRTWPRDNPKARVGSLASYPAGATTPADPAVDFRDSLAAIKPEHRETLLDWLDGRSVQESAIRMSVGRGGVQSRRTCAFAALRESFASRRP